MNKTHLKNQLSSLALSMFRKDFFGIYHGSLSAKQTQAALSLTQNEAVFR